MALSSQSIRFAVIALAMPVFWAGAALADSFLLPSPKIELIGTLSRVDAAFEDTFVSLGRTHRLGYEELNAANPGVDPW
ncbi:MAG: hypothetical protein KJO35_00530, partial [Gammaproteobacteria bacterium]|nr:hypothetical protein [Gammaproteobacteria bacterium]